MPSADCGVHPSPLARLSHPSHPNLHPSTDRCHPPASLLVHMPRNWSRYESTMGVLKLAIGTKMRAEYSKPRGSGRWQAACPASGPDAVRKPKPPGTPREIITLADLSPRHDVRAGRRIFGAEPIGRRKESETSEPPSTSKPPKGRK